MVKGQVNPLTTMLLDAEGLVMETLANLYDQFGLPLYTEDPGRGKFTWPEDPERIGPEQFQELINLWSAPVVERYLMETATRRMAEAAEEEF